jgi:hypothetical protein
LAVAAAASAGGGGGSTNERGGAAGDEVRVGDKLDPFVRCEQTWQHR